MADKLESFQAQSVASLRSLGKGHAGGGRFSPESVAGYDRNGWQVKIGISGSSRRNTHEVTDHHYVNRIWAYIDQSIKGDNRKNFIRLRLSDLGQRIEAIHDFSSQGVHGDIEKNDVDMCVIDAYLLVGALLQIKSR